MITLFQHIDNQVLFNKGRNLFFRGTQNTLKLKKSSYNFFKKVNQLDDNNLKTLLDYTTNRVITELCNTNQYYNFDSVAKSELENIYFTLTECLKLNNKPVTIIIGEHEKRLKTWLFKTNPFSYELYKDKEEFIESVTCAEYSAEVQLNILKINIHKLKGPILDIGCGKNGFLVDYLRNKGFDAYGFDRFNGSKTYISNENWLEYNYGESKWGTIISNLGFSNHFIHHNTRNNGNYIDYAKVFMKILKSLRSGGKFHYAPDLPFVECYLNSSEFSIDKYAINNTTYSTSVITRLK